MRVSGGGIRKVLRTSVLLGAIAAVLSGCSTADRLLGDLMGKSDNTVLPGKRENVLGPGAGGVGQATEPVVIPAAVTNASWSQPGGKASNANHNLALGRNLRQIFSVNAGAGSDSSGRLSAPPIVIGGRIYVLDAKGRVRAFSASTGGRIWVRSLVPDGADEDDGYGGGLCSDGRAIYAATGFGEVVAMNPANGAVLWRRKLPVPVRTAPVTAGGRIYVRDSANVLHALAVADGAEMWTHQGEDVQTSMISASAPAVGNGVVVAPFSSGDIAAFSPQGYAQWQQNISGGEVIRDIAARPVIDRGRVYAAAVTGSLVALDVRNGSEMWSLPLGGRATPWIAGDYLFHIAGGKKLAAVSVKEGAVKWSIPLPGGTWSGPVMGGGRLILVSSKGRMMEVSPQTGEVMGTRKLGEDAYITPVIAGGTLYVLLDDGTLTAFR